MGNKVAGNSYIINTKSRIHRAYKGNNTNNLVN